MLEGTNLREKNIFVLIEILTLQVACRAFVYADNNGASIAFRKALARDPNNAILLRNFNDFLQRQEPGCAEVSKYDVINFEE